MDLFAPCERYTPTTELPVEPCCTSCRALDDVWPCPVLFQRFALLGPPRPGGDPPSIPVSSTFAGCCAGRGGNT
jgi:hypothetical protein